MTRPDPEDVRLRFGMDPPRLEEQRYWEELVPGADEYPARQTTGTRVTSHSRLPWEWCAHVYVDYHDLREWPRERLDQLEAGLRQIRAAIVGPADDADGEA